MGLRAPAALCGCLEIIRDRNNAKQLLPIIVLNPRDNVMCLRGIRTVGYKGAGIRCVRRCLVGGAGVSVYIYTGWEVVERAFCPTEPRLQSCIHR